MVLNESHVSCIDIFLIWVIVLIKDAFVAEECEDLIASNAHVQCFGNVSHREQRLCISNCVIELYFRQHLLILSPYRDWETIVSNVQYFDKKWTERGLL